MSPDRPDEPDHGIDVDAAFADIVAHYGDVPAVDGPPPGHPAQRPHPVTDQTTDQTGDQAGAQTGDQTGAHPAGERTGDSTGQDASEGMGEGRGEGTGSQELTGGPAGPARGPGPGLRSRWDDPAQTPATWEDEGHFVPPPAPPLPSVEPRRRAAWLALFGAPLAMLVVIVAGVGVPGWVVAALALAFIGGFVYLVATMGASGGPDRPDDGAVV